MKFILPITIFCLSICGCKNKELPSDYLSNIHVVRPNSEMRNTTPSATPARELPAPEASPATAPTRSVYHIIVASFSYSEKGRAERLAEKLKEQGYPASVINSAQRYRVSIESFPTETAANAARDEYRRITDRQDIWVLK